MPDTPASPPRPDCLPPTRYSWEEYKLYFETTEKVIDRRIAFNTWNYGICIAMVAAAGLLAKWLIEKSELRLPLLCAIGLLSIIGMLLCRFWYRQVKDLKLLNNAKFQVLEAMAPHVVFPEGYASFQVFKKEWDILGEGGATTEKRGLKGKVLKSTGAEFLLPWAFGIVFALMLIITVTVGQANWDRVTSAIFKLPADEKGGSCKTCRGVR